MFTFQHLEANVNLWLCGGLSTHSILRELQTCASKALVVHNDPSP